MEACMPVETARRNTPCAAVTSPIAPVALNPAVCDAIDKMNRS